MNPTIPAPEIKTCVLQDWVMELPLAVQGSLMTCVRGPDGVRKHDPIKPFVRAMRSCILNNSHPLKETNTFMHDGRPTVTKKEADVFVIEHDAYPLHWYMHMVHSCAIIGYWHPSSDIANWWIQTYWDACSEIHLKPETKSEVLRRLTKGALDEERWVDRTKTEEKDN